MTERRQQYRVNTGSELIFFLLAKYILITTCRCFVGYFELFSKKFNFASYNLKINQWVNRYFIYSHEEKVEKRTRNESFKNGGLVSIDRMCKTL